jgi:hypothetical protein
VEVAAIVMLDGGNCVGNPIHINGGEHMVAVMGCWIQLVFLLLPTFSVLNNSKPNGSLLVYIVIVSIVIQLLVIVIKTMLIVKMLCKQKKDEQEILDARKAESDSEKGAVAAAASASASECDIETGGVAAAAEECTASARATSPASERHKTESMVAIDESDRAYDLTVESHDVTEENRCLHEAFAMFDNDDTGWLDKEDFRSIMTMGSSEHVELNDDDFEAFFAKVDKDSSGGISADEYIAWAGLTYK